MAFTVFESKELTWQINIALIRKLLHFGNCEKMKFSCWLLVIPPNRILLKCDAVGQLINHLIYVESMTLKLYCCRHLGFIESLNKIPFRTDDNRRKFWSCNCIDSPFCRKLLTLEKLFFNVQQAEIFIWNTSCN